VGIRVRKPIEQDVLDDAEDGGRRPNSERQGTNRNHRKARLLAEPAQPITKVLPRRMHRLSDEESGFCSEIYRSVYSWETC
jgi:hypothetical protein